MKFRTKHITGLPYKKVNKLLGLHLKSDKVHLSQQVIKHIVQKHPDEYQICLRGIDLVIQSPDFVGQSPHHKENFELVKQTEVGIILVALSSASDSRGDYPVQSSYLLEKSTLKRRVRIGHLKPLK